MNKRIEKKMYRNYKRRCFYAEGNKGADYISLFNNEDGTFHIESGSCCIKSITAVVPVEFITAIIEKVMIEYDFNIETVIDSFGWSESFKRELKSRVKDLNWRRIGEGLELDKC